MFKYVTGTGQTPAVTKRVQIYEQEGATKPVKRSIREVRECASAERSVAHAKRARPSRTNGGDVRAQLELDFDVGVFDEPQEEPEPPMHTAPSSSFAAGTAEGPHVQGNQVDANMEDLSYLSDERLFCELSGDFGQSCA